MVLPATQSTEAQNSSAKMGSIVKLFNAFLTIRPCSYEELPDTYLPSILYGLGITVLRTTVATMYLVLYGLVPSDVSVQVIIILSLLFGSLVLLAAFIFSALASWLFGRSHTPQTYSLWIGAWTYVPLVVLLRLMISRVVAGLAGLALCIINAYLLTAFANAKKPFEDQRGYMLYNVYCFIALLIGYTFC